MMKYTPISMALLIGLLTQNAVAQDSLRGKPVTFSGYLEAYYSYDLGQPANHERPAFFYNFKRHNEVNLNLGFLRASYHTEHIRGDFALMAGTYAQYNLSSEPDLLRHVLEAHMGVRISRKTDLWLDAGIMPSHIGFESAIGKDCWNLTRGILAENSPYYESGVKIGYGSGNERWYMAAMYLNGWQRVQRLAGNQTPAGGTQLTYKPNAKYLFNWSTFVGNDKPDTARQLRFYNNFYTVLKLNDRLGLTSGLDIGLQQSAKGSHRYHLWYTPILILQYALSSPVKIAARGEYYSDPRGVIIATGTANGFRTYSYSLNIDYMPSEHIIFRVEGRGLNSQDPIFTLNKKPSRNNYFFTTSLALSF